MSTTDYLNYIDGQWVPARDEAWIDVESPRNRQIIARVPRGGEKDIHDAVEAAWRAFPGWRDTAPRARGRMLQQIADALEPEIERVGPHVGGGQATRQPFEDTIQQGDQRL